MKKGLLILFGILLLGFLVEQVASRAFQHSPSEWLCHEYALSPQQAQRMQSLQAEYGNRCGPFCDEMCAANAKLRTLTLGAASITPEIRLALAEAERINTEAKITMLEHFYSVAAALPPEKRRDYLSKVLPLVIDSCGVR